MTFRIIYRIFITLYTLYVNQINKPNRIAITTSVLISTCVINKESITPYQSIISWCTNDKERVFVIIKAKAHCCKWRGRRCGETSKERHCGLRFISAFVSNQLPRDCAERYRRMRGLFAPLAQGGRLLSLGRLTCPTCMCAHIRGATTGELASPLRRKW